PAEEAIRRRVERRLERRPHRRRESAGQTLTMGIAGLPQGRRIGATRSYGLLGPRARRASITITIPNASSTAPHTISIGTPVGEPPGSCRAAAPETVRSAPP